MQSIPLKIQIFNGRIFYFREIIFKEHWLDDYTTTQEFQGLISWYAPYLLKQQNLCPSKSCTSMVSQNDQ